MRPALSNARALDDFHFFYHAIDAPQAIPFTASANLGQ
jgi:hypothetical protein